MREEDDRFLGLARHGLLGPAARRNILAAERSARKQEAKKRRSGTPRSAVRARRPAAAGLTGRAPRRARRQASRTARARDGGPQAESDPPDPPRLPRLDDCDDFSLDRASIAADTPKSTLADAIRAGRLPAERVGGGSFRGRYRITRDALLAFLARRPTAAVAR